MSLDIRTLLTSVAYRPIDVEALLDADRPSWVRFDPELGYVPNDIDMKDGIDGSRSIYSYEPCGARRVIQGRGAPCRIHTYGDSFTQCQQVTDAETWQEMLAAHLGEPVMNYGSGGYGVYQAWRRLLRVESGSAPAEHIIFNIFVDDHIRNLDAARWIRTGWNDRDRPAGAAYPLHGLPWAHLRYDVARGAWQELPGRCQTCDDLRALADPEAFYQAFKDDPIARLQVLMQEGDAEIDDLLELGKALGLPGDLTVKDPTLRAQAAATFHLSYGIRSTQWLIGQMQDWARRERRKMLFVLSYCMGTMSGYALGGPHHDQEFVDWLEHEKIPYISLGLAHAEEFARMKVPIQEYVAQYYVKAAGAAVFGHYTPAGNFFTAQALRRPMVEWLEPKPAPYR